MSDLLAMAFQTDLTRVFTFMMSREGSQRTFSTIGVADPWHVVSHHGDQAGEGRAATRRSTSTACRCSRSSSRSCKATPDGDGSLLDHSLIFYGSGMANSNVHATDPLPIVAVGGGAGAGNRHIVLPKQTQIGNLWLTVAHQFGSPMTKFGESTGTVDFF